jgi:hypothetical protein
MRRIKKKITEETAICEVVKVKRKNPRVTDRRRFTVDDMMAPDKIPFGCGRPSRNNTIGDDDIVNLKIALGLSEYVNDFIKKRGIFKKER